MSSLTIDLKDCKTVLEFLDRVVTVLKVLPFYGSNLEVLGKTISSLEKHGFLFPLKIELVNVKNYKEKCPVGWKIFLKSLEKAKEEYAKKNMELEYSFAD
ncbi:MAG TPA: barstar family protein [Candidatus Nanoarchaeia archaeon]|nr:barstar family protein [Candidatus Nanoarchaeia archaeon]